MKIFITGGTGYIGSVIADKLVLQGHQVFGLARSESSAESLRRRGIRAVMGTLDDADVLQQAVNEVEAVIQTAFLIGPDLSASVRTEGRGLSAMLAALQGTGKPLIFASGTAVLGDTGTSIYDEETPIVPSALSQRLENEQLVMNAEDAHGVVLRLPNVYGRGDGHQTFAAIRHVGQQFGAIPFAQGSGDHRWSAVHVDDAADLFLLAMQRSSGRQLYHAGAQSNLRTRDIAAALSRSMGWRGKTIELPIDELRAAFPLPAFADYWSRNSQSSSDKAKRLLGWLLTHLDMLADIGQLIPQVAA
jgi:nucleoside-diphosphate-sugar epimerase